MNRTTIKKMRNDLALVTIAEAVFMAKSWEETMREIIVPKQQELIDFWKFKPCSSWTEKKKGRGRTCTEVITSPGDMFLVSEEDFDIYQQELNQFYKEQNLSVWREGNCPLLEAESLTRYSERCFVDYLEQYTEIGFDDFFRIPDSLGELRRYIDLNLSLVSDLVNPKIAA